MVSTPIADRSAAASRASTGIFLMLGAMAILPVMDAIGKHLGQILPVLVIVWARLIFATLFTLPAVLIRHGVAGAIRPQRPLVQVARSLLMVMSTTSFFAGLRYLPIADTLAIFFIMPLVVTALSPLLLGEHVGVRRWSAVLVGFMGTLIIIRPGFQGVNVGTLWALSAGISMAVFFLLTRKIAGSVDALISNFQTTLIGAMLVSLALPMVWQAPGPENWGLLALIGDHDRLSRLWGFSRSLDDGRRRHTHRLGDLHLAARESARAAAPGPRNGNDVGNKQEAGEWCSSLLARFTERDWAPPAPCPCRAHHSCHRQP
jgi:drug/metabolite transporter (DMT)-like permease